MIVLIVKGVTPSLRGSLTRWLLEVQAGVFVGYVSSQVRDRIWTMVQGRRRLGSCTLVTRSNDEQGLNVVTVGETHCRPKVDYEGLALVRVLPRRLSSRTSVRGVAPENPSGEACGGDLLVKGPVEAGTSDREVRHLECTVLPRAE